MWSFNTKLVIAIGEIAWNDRVRIWMRRLPVSGPVRRIDEVFEVRMRGKEQTERTQRNGWGQPLSVLQGISSFGQQQEHQTS